MNTIDETETIDDNSKDGIIDDLLKIIYEKDKIISNQEKQISNMFDFINKISKLIDQTTDISSNSGNLSERFLSKSSV